MPCAVQSRASQARLDVAYGAPNVKRKRGKPGCTDWSLGRRRQGCKEPDRVAECAPLAGILSAPWRS
ncbi:hypothetical protein FH972_026311 [Carpinus fangiana]|uniref:Uncharacterized protein n=1 Tax=Carpinus fangiana TaxID=176857 RepID=A0A5N6L4L0_9ROSI|nr:hypothetical protein FH972_026311 [Carpinus fangiana]